jgi:topoisomerase IA-like protein
MSLSHLSVQELEHAVELLREKESLQSSLDKVNRQLQQLENGDLPIQVTRTKHGNLLNSRRMKRRAPRGKNLQQSVMEALKGAGAKGLSVKELASRAQVKLSSLRVWLYTKAKAIAGIKKLGPGTFAYTSN